MEAVREDKSRGFRQSYGLIIRIGLGTAGVILVFEIVNLLVMYRYVKLDYYLCLVAIFFLMVGLVINQRRAKVDGKEQEAGPVADDLDFGPVAGNGNLGMTPVMEKTVPGILGLLSAKEWQVLKLVAEGKTNKEIASVQFIELSTVKTHLNNIYGKLSVSNRKEARVKYAELAPLWPGA